MNKVKTFLAGWENTATEGIQDQARLQQENEFFKGSFEQASCSRSCSNKREASS